MNKLVTLIFLCSTFEIALGIELPTNSSVQENGTVEDMLEYAVSFAGEGDYLRARIVYDLMLRAFRDSNNRRNAELTCKSLVENISSKEIGKLNRSFWTCPRALLERWYDDLDAYAHEPLQLKRGKRPLYPAEMIGESGHVKVQFDVDKNGTVLNIRILESTDERLTASILNMLKSHAYHPPRHYGNPVAIADVIRLFTFDTEE